MCQFINHNMYKKMRLINKILKIFTVRFITWMNPGGRAVDLERAPVEDLGKAGAHVHL